MEYNAKGWGVTNERSGTDYRIWGPVRGLEPQKKLKTNGRTSQLVDQFGPEGRVGENKCGKSASWETFGLIKDQVTAVSKVQDCWASLLRPASPFLIAGILAVAKIWSKLIYEQQCSSHSPCNSGQAVFSRWNLSNSGKQWQTVAPTWNSCDPE